MSVWKNIEIYSLHATGCLSKLLFRYVEIFHNVVTAWSVVLRWETTVSQRMKSIQTKRFVTCAKDPAKGFYSESAACSPNSGNPFLQLWCQQLAHFYDYKFSVGHSLQTSNWNLECIFNPCHFGFKANTEEQEGRRAHLPSLELTPSTECIFIQNAWKYYLHNVEKNICGGFIATHRMHWWGYNCGDFIALCYRDT